MWRLDAVMRRVLTERGVEPGSLREVFVRERRALVGAFSLAMVLLAPVTAGASAVIGAGVTALVAGRHIQ